MAQQDTGLGWSAESSWLWSGTGKIADFNKLSAPDFPNQPIPECGATYSAAEVIAGGMVVALNTNNGNVVYAGCQAGSPPVFICFDSDLSLSRPSFIAVSSQSGVKGRVELATPLGSPLYGGTFSTSNHDSVSGLWYGTTTLGNRAVDTTFIPSYTDGPAACAAIVQTSTSYYKLNDGYAVAAVVHYHNEHGGDTFSPCLISTDAAAVALSTDGSTPCPYVTYRYAYEGMAFYMSLIPSADYDGCTPTAQLADLRNYAVLFPQGVFNTVVASDRAYVQVTGPTDPYGPDPSTEAGGGGTDPEDDEVPLEPVVFPSALGTGFCRLYCPTAGELQALSNYLWGPLFDLNNVKRLFADPMDSILGLSVVPILISGSPEVVSVAGVSTGISLSKLSAQHINVDLGSLQVVEKWGAYLDYEPYTKYSIYLPFIGYRTVSADDIMGKWVHLSYDIDLLSGACVAKLVSGSTLLYQWAGTCAMQLPVNAGNWNSVIQSTIATIGSVATGIASGGAAAPLVAGSLAAAATQASTMKPNVERAGGLSGAAAFLSGRRAYMIRTYPRMVNPGDQPHFIGYPSFITKQLGTVSGYNVVEDIHLEGIPATQTELEEIDTLLHEGVIL